MWSGYFEYGCTNKWLPHKHEQYLPQRLLGTGQRRPSWKLRHKGWKKHWAPGTYHAPNITQSTNGKHVWNIGTYDNHSVNFRNNDLPVLHRRLSRLPHGFPKLTHRAKWCVLRIRCYMGRQKAIRRYLTVGPSWMNCFEGPPGSNPTLSDAHHFPLKLPEVYLTVSDAIWRLYLT